VFYFVYIGTYQLFIIHLGPCEVEMALLVPKLLRVILILAADSLLALPEFL